MDENKTNLSDAAPERTVDIFDLLPAEAHKRIDELGYKLLADNGYNVAGAAEDEVIRKAISEEMVKRDEYLTYVSAIDSDNGNILIWFKLFRNTELIAESQGIKFIQSEGDNDG